MWGRKGLIIAGFFGLLLVGAVTLALWGYGRDPLLSLAPPEHGLKAERTTLPAPDHRLLSTSRSTGNCLAISSSTSACPIRSPLKNCRSFWSLGGLVTGADSIRYLKDAGDNAIVSYAWPIPVRLHGVSAFMLQAPGLYHRVMTIPGQVASALHWLIEPPWADAERISLLGFSQGALAVLPCRTSP